MVPTRRSVTCSSLTSPTTHPFRHDWLIATLPQPHDNPGAMWGSELSFPATDGKEASCMPIVGPSELLVLLVIAVVIFGAGWLTRLGGGLGKGVREFRSATRERSEPTAPSPRVSPATTHRFCSSCGTDNPGGRGF